MAPADLLRPLEGQREETLRIVTALAEGDLDRTDRGSGWTVRELFAHLVSTELGIAFVIRRALEGDVLHLGEEDRDSFIEARVEGAEDWTPARVEAELVEARGLLRAVFAEMDEEDLDRQIRWPEWPARTVRTSIPYMLEHEDAHLDQVRSALGRNVS